MRATSPAPGGLASSTPPRRRAGGTRPLLLRPQPIGWRQGPSSSLATLPGPWGSVDCLPGTKAPAPSGARHPRGGFCARPGRVAFCSSRKRALGLPACLSRTRPHLPRLLHVSWAPAGLSPGAGAGVHVGTREGVPPPSPSSSVPTRFSAPPSKHALGPQIRPVARSAHGTAKRPPGPGSATSPQRPRRTPQDDHISHPCGLSRWVHGDREGLSCPHPQPGGVTTCLPGSCPSLALTLLPPHTVRRKAPCRGEAPSVGQGGGRGAWPPSQGCRGLSPEEREQV